MNLPLIVILLLNKTGELLELEEMIKNNFIIFIRRTEVHIKNAEANETLKNLCGREWRNHRAVVFLDPFGMEVDFGKL